jgi:hypothetical protein
VHRQWGWSAWITFPITTVLTLLVAGFLGWEEEKQEDKHPFVGGTEEKLKDA